MKNQAKLEEEGFDEFCREVARAARADGEVIEAAADSPFLFQRVRAQLATAPEPRRRSWLALLRGACALPKLSFAATGLAIVAAGLLFAYSTRVIMPEPPAALVAENPVSAPRLFVETPSPTSPQNIRTIAAVSTRRAKNQASRRDAPTRAEEITTDYLPLTYVASTGEPDSGHVVRVQVPRSALLTLGVPMGAELSAELVKADVIVGDDGLARAIRLVR